MPVRRLTDWRIRANEMSATKIAKRYAQGLFDLALEQDRLGPVRSDLQVLFRLIDESAEFARFLQDPLVTPERCAGILRELFADKVEPLVYKNILFLVHKRRISYLQGICTAFDDLYNAHKRILPILIIAAKPITDSHKADIATRLHAKFDHTIQSSVRIDASLLGGLKIIIGDQVFDHSLETQLNRFRKNVIGA